MKEEKLKEVKLFFPILCFICFMCSIVLFAACAGNPVKSVSAGQAKPVADAVQNASGTEAAEGTTGSAGTAEKAGTEDTTGTAGTERTSGNLVTRNCMLDEAGNLFVKNKDGYESYVYDRFPGISGNLPQIIKMLRESDNAVTVEYNETVAVEHNGKLFVYYALEERKSRIAGGNDVDIFNFSIDREQDIVEFSVENLVFPGLLDDDYRSLLQETFNLLFGESGGDMYRYFMAFYEQASDGITDEARINGMLVKYSCTPKHKLSVFLADNGQQLRE